MNKYDNEPVHFCKKCLSLKILTGAVNGEEFDYCDDCDSEEIAVAPNIQAWEELYVGKYGHKFIDEKRK